MSAHPLIGYESVVSTAFNCNPPKDETFGIMRLNFLVSTPNEVLVVA